MTVNSIFFQLWKQEKQKEPTQSRNSEINAYQYPYVNIHRRKKLCIFFKPRACLPGNYLHHSSGLVHHAHSNHHFHENLHPRFLKLIEHASSMWFLDAHLHNIRWFCTELTCRMIIAGLSSSGLWYRQFTAIHSKCFRSLAFQPFYLLPPI